MKTTIAITLTVSVFFLFWSCSLQDQELSTIGNLNENVTTVSALSHFKELCQAEKK